MRETHEPICRRQDFAAARFDKTFVAMNCRMFSRVHRVDWYATRHDATDLATTRRQRASTRQALQTRLLAARSEGPDFRGWIFRRVRGGVCVLGLMLVYAVIEPAQEDENGRACHDG